MKTEFASRCGKGLGFLLCLTPLALLAFRVLSGDLGPNPVETLSHTTGDWALRLLLLTLALGPLARLPGLSWVNRYGRLCGLFAFFYALLHLVIYLVLDQDMNWEDIGNDLTERPFILAGLGAFGLLIPLAVTSTHGWRERLGPVWHRLHRLSYVSAGLAVLHFLCLAKADLREPLIYGVVLLGLLVWRLMSKSRQRGKTFI